MSAATLVGGDALAKALAELGARLAQPGELRVGFLEDATYPDGTSVAMVAAVQNFGAPARGIPPRPFFSNMVAAKSPKWGDSLANILKLQDYNIGKSLELMGEGIAGQLRQSIRDTNAPPLSPITIERKGFEKPLIDTAVMWNSISYEVTTGGAIVAKGGKTANAPAEVVG